MARNDWTRWSKYVLKELERLNDNYDALNQLLMNHVNHTNKRLAIVETSLQNTKYFVGIVLTIITAILAAFKLL